MTSRRAIAPIALLVAAVLAFDPGGRAPFGPAKWAAIGPLVLVAAAVPLAERRPAGGPSLAVASSVAWAAFLVWTALTAAVGLDGVFAWIGTPERRFGVVTWLLCGVAYVAGAQLRDHERRALALAAATAVGVLGVVVVGELAGVRAVELVGRGARPVATLGSSAFLGAAAALLLPIATGAAIGARGWPSGVAVLLGTVALVAAGARAAWIGVAVAGLVVVVVHRDRMARRSRGTFVVAGALVLLLGLLGAVTGVGDRVTSAVGSGPGGAAGRLDEWRVATRAVAQRPITGAGPEGYRIAFGRAVDDRYEQRHGRDPIPDRAHDSLLDVAATTGFPGLVAYGAVVALSGRFVVRALRRRDDPVTTGLGAGALAYGIQGLFLFPLAELDPVAWLVVGATAAATSREAERKPIPMPLRRPLAVAASAAAAVLVVLGVTEVIADRHARSGRGEVAADLRPDVVGHHLLAAAEHEAVGSSAGLDRAIAAVGRARRVSRDDPAVRSEWTRLLLERAQRTGSPRHVVAAREALEQLVALDPRNALVLLRLGVARALSGDGAGAERAWLEAERLAPRSASASVDLALAYADQGRVGDALDAVRRALEREPDNGTARQLLRRLEAADGT